MKLLVEQSNYVIENFHEINSFEEISDVLSCFLDENVVLMFGCIDLEWFLSNLHNEDIATQNLYKKLIEYNSNNFGESILIEDENELEKKKFIKERTVFINFESDFPLYQTANKKRRTIWYKALNKNEVIKAVNINQFFRCIVIREGMQFHDYLYALAQYETDDGFNMKIVEKEKGSFLRSIYPRLKKYFKD